MEKLYIHKIHLDNFVPHHLEVLRYKPEGSGFDSQLYCRNFSFRPHYGPGVDTVSNKNEYQEYFLRVKSAGA